MSSAPLSFATPAFDPAQEILALSAQTMRIVAVAQALLDSDRPVALDGLQNQIGLLCAKALDLPPGQTALARSELRRLASSLDALHADMRSKAA